MTRQIQQFTYQDVKPHIRNYVIKSFPVDGTSWEYNWYYDNGADTVNITLTINGKTVVHHVPFLDIIE
jgi:archaellum component FlaF (FlaF/FlaG flagellin family)